MPNNLLGILPVVFLSVGFAGCGKAEQDQEKKTSPAPEGILLVVHQRGEPPSRLPWEYAEYLDPENSRCILAKTDVRPGCFMTQSFYGGKLDPTKKTLENLVFFSAMNPEHIRPMMAELQDLDPQLIRKLKDNRRGCLVGRQRLAAMKMSVGQSFKITGVNLEGIDLEFDIEGQLPDGKHDYGAIMNVAHLKAAFAEYERANGRKHAEADRSLNMIWLRVEDRQALARVKKQIESSPLLANPPSNCRTEEEIRSNLQ